MVNDDGFMKTEEWFSWRKIKYKKVTETREEKKKDRTNRCLRGWIQGGGRATGRDGETVKKKGGLLINGKGQKGHKITTIK
jgi:hypothetical protein